MLLPWQLNANHENNSNAFLIGVVFAFLVSFSFFSFLKYSHKRKEAFNAKTIQKHANSSGNSNRNGTTFSEKISRRMSKAHCILFSNRICYPPPPPQKGIYNYYDGKVEAQCYGQTIIIMEMLGNTISLFLCISHRSTIFIRPEHLI